MRLHHAIVAGTLAALLAGLATAAWSDPVIVSGVEARVAEPVFAPQAKSWTSWLGPTGPYYPERAARDRRKVIPGEAVLECTLLASSRLTDCKVLSEMPRDHAFGVAALRMVERGALTATPRMVDGEAVASERVRMVVPFAPPAKR